MRNRFRRWLRRKHVCAARDWVQDNERFTHIWCTAPRCDFTVYMGPHGHRAAFWYDAPKAYEYMLRHEGLDT